MQKQNILIMPLGGKSSRYPDVSRPKWLLNMPNGNLMIQESINKLELNLFNKICFICLEEHEEKYNVKEIFKKAFKNINYELILIDNSQSQPETVYKGLKKFFNEDVSFVIKDCDNTFSVPNIKDVIYKNFVAYGLIGKDFNNGDVQNKSYIKLNDFNQIYDIVEKYIVSDKFCTGMYGFESSKKFINIYDKLNNEKVDMKNLYISHIIYKMIIENELFIGTNVNNYIDWGTQEEYEKYKSQFATLMIDFDGVLVNNSAQYFNPIWGTTESLKDNVDYLKELHDKGKIQIIITTARTEEFKEITLKQIKKYNIPYDKIVFGCWHSKRILINDFAGSNNYRTADSINIKRNSNDLKSYLKGLLK